MPDGSILFCMYHNGYVLIKTDSNGNVTANDDPVAPAPTASIICYPQPAANSVMVSVKSDLVGDLGYSIINVKGQKKTFAHGSLKLTPNSEANGVKR